MNAPIIWILLPGITAGVLYLLYRYVRLVKILGFTIVFILVLLAWQLPIGEAFSLGPWPALSFLRVTDTLNVLGRQFILTASARPVLILIYLGTLIWLIGAMALPVSRLFVPTSLAISAMLVAAISVEPFLFAALFIQVAVLLCMPILSPPGKPIVRGALRFLIYQTLGMLLILGAGWMLGRIAINPNDSEWVRITTIILGVGFVVQMSVFPFNSWMPMTAEKSPPFAAGYVFFALPGITALIALIIFSRYSWLQVFQVVNLSFQVVGLLMVVGASVWAIFQQNLGRILGYAVITQVGLMLLAISQALAPDLTASGNPSTLATVLPQAGSITFLLLVRGFNLAVWSFSIAVIRNNTQGLDFSEVQGLAHKFPVATISLALAGLSVAGYPALAGFQTRALIGTSVSQLSPWIAGMLLASFLGLAIAILKSLSILLGSPAHTGWLFSESRSQLGLLILGCLLLLGIGMIPQSILIFLASLGF